MWAYQQAATALIKRHGNGAHTPSTLVTGAQWTIEWDHAVVVTEIEVIMTRHGVIEVEGFVGGTADPWVGQYDAEQLNEGWVSLGVAQGRAFTPAAVVPLPLSPYSLFSLSPPARPLSPWHTREHACLPLCSRGATRVLRSCVMWLRGGRTSLTHPLSFLTRPAI